ncbi:YafY family protein [Sporomusa sp. KB1]|uniref:helix-turn-helix transcriptional regulator n=1 Tax=Sporomusa sp. KB1 TaxID=943346 RepID=UPI0011A03C30|nr:WYL domain-containing protein [Sporomusa sp. KB1]TWH49278.1 putative DNA-binding transcriptional regulator YafY [Sporomusa sp. KB1]
MQEESKHNKAQRMISHILKLLQHFPEGGLTFEDLFDEDEYDERKIRHDLKDLTEMTEELGWRFNKPTPGRPGKGEEKKYFLDIPFIPELDDKQTFLNLLMIERFEKRPWGFGNTEAERQCELLQRLLRYKLFTQYIEKMRNRVIFMEPEFQNRDDISQKLAECMDALAHEKVLSFKYNQRMRIVWPLGLISKDERWYLRAYCCEAKEQRTYRLDRMADVSKTGKKYDYPGDFSLQELTKNAWAVLFENQGDLISVRLIADELAAEELINTKFHPSQKIETLHDGRVRVTFELDTWKGMVGWILRWGYLVEILEPEDLRNEIKGIAKKIVANYENPVNK